MAIEPPLQVGAVVRLFAKSRYIELEYESDYNEWRAENEREQEAKWELQRQQEQERKARRIQASQTFYSGLNIPFRFTIEVKEVLSGLSANSNGDGQKRNTVYHVYLKEAFQQGRLIRKAGDFLCSQSQARSGANWSDSLGQGTFTLDQDGTQPVPTCKQCLAALERFKKAAEVG